MSLDLRPSFLRSMFESCSSDRTFWSMSYVTFTWDHVTCDNQFDDNCAYIEVQPITHILRYSLSHVQVEYYIGNT